MEQWQGTALLTGEILSVWLHHHHCSLCISIISPIRHIYSNIKREMKGYIIFLMYNIYYTPIPLTAQMKPDKAACGDRSKVILSLLNRPTTTLCDGREIIVTVITPISQGRTPGFRGVKWFSLGAPPPGLVKAGLVLKTFHLILWDPYIAGCLWGCIHSFTHLLICLVYIEWVLLWAKCEVLGGICEGDHLDSLLSQQPERGASPGWSSPGNIAQSLETLRLSQWEGCYWVSSESMLHMLPNILQYTGWPSNKELSILKCQ